MNNKRFFKKFLSLILSFVLLFTAAPFLSIITAFAESSNSTSGTTGDCTWELDGTVLTISGNGKTDDYGSSDGVYVHFAPWGRDITEVIIKKGVTGIGSQAFYNCSKLLSIEMPDSVTTIGASAFYSCKITLLKIAEGSDTITDKMVVCKKTLEKVIIPESITSVGYNAFQGCNNLKEVHINDVAKWCNIDFYENDSNPLRYADDFYVKDELVTNLILPNGVTDIGNFAFTGYKGLTDITLPESVTTIGYTAFYGCTGLTNITIPESVTTIGNYAFYGCTGLKNIKLPENITTIGYSVFSSCSRLTNISIPKSVTTIRDYAFSNCTGLTEITFPESVTTIENYAFTGCTGLTNITIPERVATIGKYAFSDCTGLTNITIPKSVTTIGECAFSDCTKLTNITFSESVTKSVTTIGKYAFSNCISLTRVIIPTSVKIIESGAFSDCLELKKITIPESVTSIVGSAFKNTHSDFVIYTTDNSVAHKYAKKNRIKVYLTKITRSISSPEVEKMQNVENQSVKITLKPTKDFEYKFNNCEWQKSNVFEKLSFDEDYTFYQRLGETDENVASSASEAAIIHTKKKNLSIPKIPEVVSKTAFTISLKETEGYEYSIDGLNWQKSCIFSGLKSNYEYTLYQRIAETNILFSSGNSVGISVKTLKLQNDSVPNKPTLFSKTDTSITLQSVEGYEYSIDGVNWQKEPTFKNLNPKTEYAIYQRISETETTYPSGNSDPIIVKTYPEHYCSDCLNIGYNEETVTCKKCNGSGKILNGYFYTCPKCELRVIENITGYGTYYTCGKCGFLSRADKNASYIGCTLCKATGKVTEKVKCKTCNGTGVLYIPGDLNGDEGISNKDAIYLLYHTFLPEKYPVNQNCDFNGDGVIDNKDAIYLLYHTFLPDKYPLK